MCAFKICLMCCIKRVFDWLIIMGSIFGKLFSKLWSKKELKIIIIGLDNSGKTTILSTTPFTQTNSTSTKSSRPCPVTVSSFSHRLQHGSSPVQKFAVPGVGPWRAEFHQARITFIQTVLGDVLPQHQRHSLRGRQPWHTAFLEGRRRALQSARCAFCLSRKRYYKAFLSWF